MMINNKNIRPKISVIVPIYNTDSRLNRCIESIMHQTFIDFECLMVDDGSKKNVADIVDSYAEKDSRFIALHKKNGGVQSARLEGFRKSRGKYIAFIDSDDYVHLTQKRTDPPLLQPG